MNFKYKVRGKIVKISATTITKKKKFDQEFSDKIFSYENIL